MAFQVFEEGKVRGAILKKAPLNLKHGKRSGHQTAFLEVNGKKVSHFRIPNNHQKAFSQGKARELARKLFLTARQYRDFVVCTFKKRDYLAHLERLFA